MAGEGERWKRKYFEELKTSEQLEKRLDSQTEQLRKAVLSISLVAEGRTPELDDHLAQLRDFLRQGQLTGLSKLVDRLEGSHEKWMGHQESFKQQLVESLITLETQYKGLPKACLSPLKKLRKKVRQTEASDLLLAMISVLGQWADAMSQPSDSGSAGGWFSRLFSGKGAAQQTDATSSTNDASDDSAHFEIPAKALDGLETLTTDLSNLLADLIKKLTLPNDEQPKAMRLLTKAHEGLDWYELVPALEVLSELVLSALDSEQEDFESFLKSLNERLLTLHEVLASSETLKTDFEHASAAFDEQMRGHLDVLKRTLSDSSAAADYGSLKQSVSTQLDHVFTTLEGFRSAQRDREQTFEDQIADLNARLNQMGDELKSAQEQLNKTRLKALTDSLTQLPNRGAYDIYIQREVDRYKRYQSPLCLLVCDVDKFKSVNDTFGHQAGDKVLQIIAKQVKRGTRDTDLVARYGGEEFVVILPDTDAAGALQVAEKIRQQVEKSPFHFKGKPVQVTISCGIAEFSGETTADQVFEAADRALYQAKEGGRNQCRLAETGTQ